MHKIKHYSTRIRLKEIMHVSKQSPVVLVDQVTYSWFC